MELINKFIDTLSDMLQLERFSNFFQIDEEEYPSENHIESINEDYEIVDYCSVLIEPTSQIWRYLIYKFNRNMFDDRVCKIRNEIKWEKLVNKMNYKQNEILCKQLNQFKYEKIFKENNAINIESIRELKHSIFKRNVVKFLLKDIENLIIDSELILRFCNNKCLVNNIEFINLIFNYCFNNHIELKIISFKKPQLIFNVLNKINLNIKEKNILTSYHFYNSIFSKTPIYNKGNVLNKECKISFEEILIEAIKYYKLDKTLLLGHENEIIKNNIHFPIINYNLCKQYYLQHL